MKMLICGVLALFAAGTALGNLGDDNLLLLKHYGKSRGSHQAADGATVTDYSAGAYLIHVVVRGSRSILETYELADHSAISQTAMQQILKKESDDHPWREVTGDSAHRTWLRDGATASVTLDSKSFSVGRVPSESVVATHSVPTPAAHDLLNITKDRFTGALKIELAIPIEVISHDTDMQLFVSIPEGSLDLSATKVR